MIMSHSSRLQRWRLSGHNTVVIRETWQCLAPQHWPPSCHLTRLSLFIPPRLTVMLLDLQHPLVSTTGSGNHWTWYFKLVLIRCSTIMCIQDIVTLFTEVSEDKRSTNVGLTQMSLITLLMGLLLCTGARVVDYTSEDNTLNMDHVPMYVTLIVSVMSDTYVCPTTQNGLYLRYLKFVYL